MLSKEDRDELERRLQEEREQTVELLRNRDQEHAASLEEETGELSSYRFHPADLGTETMEREKSFLLGSKEGERLYRIDEALRRLYGDPEAAGRCSNCGQDISMERLRLIPETDLCARCAGGEAGGEQG